MELSRYLRFYPQAAAPETVLLYSTLRGTAVQVPADFAASLRRGELDADETSEMARLGILVPDAGAEQRQLAGYFDWVNAATDRFTAIVTLNLDCNLACPYCYEGHFRGDRYMSEATAAALVAFITNGPLAAGREVLIDFYGGEPLLSLPLLKRIAAALQAAAGEGGRFSFNLVTNGTLLTGKVVEELLPLGLAGVKVTVDGPAEIHDRQRPYVSGRGSYGRILRNLREVAALTRLQLGGNYTRENYRRFPELLDNLVAAGITPEMIYMVQFSPVSPSAGEAGKGEFTMGCACINEPWLIEASLYLRGEILRRGWNTPKPKLACCMVEFTNDLVVAWDGALYKCPAFMGWTDLQIGTLADGVGDYRQSHNMAVWKCDECLDCPYLPLCFGGCRFLRRLRTGAIDGIDCRRAYLDAALETIVRQDYELRQRRPVAPD